MLFVIHYWIFAPIIYAMEKARLDKEGNVSESRGKVLAGRLALGMLTCTMVNIFIVELSKGYVGRLRPSFAQACLDQAAPYSQEILSRAFLSDADCITNNKEALVDMRRSFPSGHASLGLGGAVYMQLCLTRFAQRADGEMKAMGLMVCGWVVTTFGFWVGASRVFDGAHHVGDVAVGFVVGIVAAAVHFWFVVGRNSIEEKAACAAGAGMVKAGKEQ